MTSNTTTTPATWEGSSKVPITKPYSQGAWQYETKWEPIQAAKWSHRIIFGRVQDECFDEFDDELFDEFVDEFLGKFIDEFVENLGDFWCFVSILVTQQKWWLLDEELQIQDLTQPWENSRLDQTRLLCGCR